PSKRATGSELPPAENGAISVMGWAGQSAALTGMAVAIAAAAAIAHKNLYFIFSSLERGSLRLSLRHYNNILSSASPLYGSTKKGTWVSAVARKPRHSHVIRNCVEITNLNTAF